MSYIELADLGDDPHTERIVQRRAESEFQQGLRETREAQEAGPAGSAEREAAYLANEMRAYNEGWD